MLYILHMNEIVAMHGYSCTLYIGTGTLVKNICKEIIARYVHCCSGHGLDFSASGWCTKTAREWLPGQCDCSFMWLTQATSKVFVFSFTFLPVGLYVIFYYFIFYRQADQGCLSETDRIWTKQILVCKRWFVLHCALKRKLCFIMCFDSGMQTCFSDAFNT